MQVEVDHIIKGIQERSSKSQISALGIIFFFIFPVMEVKLETFMALFTILWDMHDKQDDCKMISTCP